MGSEFVMGARFELEDEFSQPMSKMAKASGDFQQSLNDSSGVISKLNEGFISSGKTMQSWGTTASKYITAPLAGIGTAALWTTAKFDDSMSKVAAISGATGDEFDELRGKALELGSTTAHSASAAADAMGYLALAGWDTNQILEATPALLNLASAAGMDLATSADIVSDQMSAFQMEAEQAAQAADMFAATQSSANTDVLQLGEALKYAGAAANASGMDMAQTNAILGVLADNSIKGSMAGTTFTSMLSDMRKNADDGTFAMGDMSVALYDAQGNMRDLGTIMGEIEQATQGMNTATRDAALGNVFGEQAMKGVNAMLSAGSDRYRELEDTIRDSAGASAHAAEIMEDNIGGAIRGMRSAIEGFMITIGDHLKGPISEGAKFISDLALRFSNLNPGVQKSIVIMGVLAAAIGPVLMVLGTLMTVIGTIGLPIVGLVAGIGVLIGILTALYMNSETARNMMNNAFASIVAAGQWLWGQLVSGFNWLMQVLPGIVDMITNGIVTAFNWVMTTLVPIVQSIIADIMTAFTAVGDWFSQYWEQIKTVVSVAWAGISAFIGTYLEFIKNLIVNGFQFVLSAVQSVWQMISGVIKVAWSLISGIIGIGLSILTGDWQGAWDAMLDMLSGVWDGITTFFGGLKDLFFESGKMIINTLVDGIKAVAMAPVEAVKGVFDKVRNLLPFSDAKEGPFSMLTANGEKIVTTIGDGIDNMKGYLGSKLESTLATARKFLPFSDAKKGPFSDLRASGGAIISTLAEGVTKKEGMLAAAMVGAFALMPGGTGSVDFQVEAVPEFYTTLNVATLFDNPDVPTYETGNGVYVGGKVNPAGGSVTQNTGSTITKSVHIDKIEVNGAEGQDVEELASAVMDKIYEDISEADEIVSSVDKGDLL